jgi:hypothetical protein
MDLAISHAEPIRVHSQDLEPFGKTIKSIF